MPINKGDPGYEQRLEANAKQKKEKRAAEKAAATRKLAEEAEDNTRKREKNKLRMRNVRKKGTTNNTASSSNSSMNNVNVDGYSSEGYSSDYSVAIPSTPPVKQMHRTAVPAAYNDELEVPSTPSKPHHNMFFLAMQEKNALRMAMLKQSTELSKNTQSSLLESKKQTQSSLLESKKQTDSLIEANGKAAQEQQNTIYNDGISDLDEVMAVSSRNLLPDIKEEKELTPTKMDVASASPSASSVWHERDPFVAAASPGRKPTSSTSHQKYDACLGPTTSSPDTAGSKPSFAHLGSTTSSTDAAGSKSSFAHLGSTTSSTDAAGSKSASTTSFADIESTGDSGSKLKQGGGAGWTSKSLAPPTGHKCGQSVPAALPGQISESLASPAGRKRGPSVAAASPGWMSKSSASPAGRKRGPSVAVASPGRISKSLASAGRKRGPSVAVASPGAVSRKVKAALPVLEPIFAVRPLDCLSEKELCLDEINAPQQYWEFKLDHYISKISTSLKAEDPKANYNFYIVGVRSSPLQFTFRELGISPVEGVSENTTLTLPHFSVHAMLKDLHDPDEVYVEDDGKFGKTIFTSKIGIGKKHTWKEVTVPAVADVTVKVLNSICKRSKRTIRGMTDTDERLATSAQVWFKPKFDMNNTNPFETFKLTIPPEVGVDEDGEMVELKGENEMYIDLDDFKEARTLVLKEKIAVLDASPTPEWNTEWTTKEKKQKLWNGMYLEPDDDKWYSGFLCETMINCFISNYENELAHVEDAGELVKTEAKRALKDHLPKMQQQYQDYSSDLAQKIRTTTKHYKIFPSNNELQHILNRGNLGHINSMVGNATAVFPEAGVGANEEEDDFKNGSTLPFAAAAGSNSSFAATSTSSKRKLSGSGTCVHPSHLSTSGLPYNVNENPPSPGDPGFDGPCILTKIHRKGTSNDGHDKDCGNNDDNTDSEFSIKRTNLSKYGAAGEKGNNYSIPSTNANGTGDDELIKVEESAWIKKALHQVEIRNQNETIQVPFLKIDGPDAMNRLQELLKGTLGTTGGKSIGDALCAVEYYNQAREEDMRALISMSRNGLDPSFRPCRQDQSVDSDDQVEDEDEEDWIDERETILKDIEESILDDPVGLSLTLRDGMGEDIATLNFVSDDASAVAWAFTLSVKVLPSLVENGKVASFYGATRMVESTCGLELPKKVYDIILQQLQKPLQLQKYRYTKTEQGIICRQILSCLPEGAVAQILLISCDVDGDRGTNLFMGTKHEEFKQGVYKGNLQLYIESPPKSSPVDLSVLATSIGHGKFDCLSLVKINNKMDGYVQIIESALKANWSIQIGLDAKQTKLSSKTLILSDCTYDNDKTIQSINADVLIRNNAITGILALDEVQGTIREMECFIQSRSRGQKYGADSITFFHSTLTSSEFSLSTMHLHKIEILEGAQSEFANLLKAAVNQNKKIKYGQWDLLRDGSEDNCLILDEVKVGAQVVNQEYLEEVLNALGIDVNEVVLARLLGPEEEEVEEFPIEEDVVSQSQPSLRDFFGQQGPKCSVCAVPLKEGATVCEACGKDTVTSSSAPTSAPTMSAPTGPFSFGAPSVAAPSVAAPMPAPTGPFSFGAPSVAAPSVAAPMPAPTGPFSFGAPSVAAPSAPAKTPVKHKNARPPLAPSTFKATKHGMKLASTKKSTEISKRGKDHDGNAVSSPPSCRTRTKRKIDTETNLSASINTKQASPSSKRTTPSTKRTKTRK